LWVAIEDQQAPWVVPSGRRWDGGFHGWSLAAIIRGQIESGDLAPGQQLPSIVTLAADYEIAVPTVRKAISLLKAEGLITGVAGYGTFVAER
jgi:GntR family transcriptional regulator